MRRIFRTVGVVALLSVAGVGCSSKLETGYEPRALGASPTERRGYYASPFTPEATVAPQAQADDMRNMRRPGNIR